MIGQQIKVHKDKAYIILKKSIKSKFEKKKIGINMEAVKAVQNWVGADHTLQDDNYFYFCKTIQDVDFKEIKLKKTKK